MSIKYIVVILYGLINIAYFSTDVINLGADIHHTIGFQVHSWNDIRAWEQGFKKGVQWMKIDPHYMPMEFCENQQTVKNSSLGCFVLSHDTPSENYQYFSMDNVLDYIMDAQYIEYFQRSDWKMVIALCFKYEGVDVCDNSTSTTNWRQLVTQVVNEANSIISQNQLNLEFILDGSATAPCLSNLWKPWVGTWWGSPEDPRFVSNNQTLGYDTSAVLDPPIYGEGNATFWLSTYAPLHFGKFPNEPYPWLWWEPSDQRTILEVCDAYLETGQTHEPGFLFAINIDPVQFTVYSGSRSQKAWNQALLVKRNESNPLVTVVPFEGLFVMITTFTRDYVQFYQASTFKKILGIFDSSRKELPLRNFETEVMSLSSAIVANESVILMSDGAGSYTIFTITSDVYQLKEVSTGTVQTGSSTFSSVSIIPSANGLSSYLIQNSIIDSALYLTIWKMNSSYEVEKLGSIKYPTGINAVKIRSTAQATSRDTIEGVSTFATQHNEIYYAYFSFSLITGLFEVVVSPTYMDIGSTPQISMTLLNQSYYVLSVHDQGFCWNSEVHNKQPGPLLCDLLPTSSNSTKNILNYSFGQLSDWISAISSGTFLSPCDFTGLLHGTYDTGSNPSAVLVGDLVSEIGGVVEVHEGVQESTEESLECGIAVKYDGLVVDSWVAQIYI